MISGQGRGRYWELVTGDLFKNVDHLFNLWADVIIYEVIDLSRQLHLDITWISVEIESVMLYEHMP